MCKYAGMSDAERVSLRISRIGLKRLKQLRGEEREIKRSIHPNVATVLADKGLLLWKEMLSAVHDYPDPNVFSEFVQGTPLLAQPPFLN